MAEELRNGFGEKSFMMLSRNCAVTERLIYQTLKDSNDLKFLGSIAKPYSCRYEGFSPFP